MAMVYNEKENILRFDVPNSEANLNAQHYGIVDRTVGSYYMSDRYDLCEYFLNNFDGEYYIEIGLSVRNAKSILNVLKNKGYENGFKSKLIAQEQNIKALEWMENNGDYFYKMKTPTVNSKRKYLKLDNEDNVINSFKSLILGDLCSLYIKKIGINGFIFYIDKNPNFDDIIRGNRVLEWMK
jgi:hypothetical protein